MQTMQRHMKRQTGLTMISWIGVITVAGIMVLMTLKLLPVYIEHFSVTSSLKSLSSDPDSVGLAPAQVRDRLMKRLDINNVRRVVRDDVIIDRDGDVYLVAVNYEVRIPFVHNIEFLVTFDDTAKVSVR